MLPVLLEFDLPGIGPVPVRTYGLAVMLGHVAGILVLVHFARLRRVDPWHIAAGACVAFPVGFLGAKLWVVFAYWDKLVTLHSRILETGGGRAGSALSAAIGEGGRSLGAALEIALALLRSGGTFQLGLLTGAAAGIWYLSRIDIPFWRALDSVACAIPLGHAIGRLGCFSAGCCYGIPTRLPWAVVFPEVSAAPTIAPTGIPIHPTQLYAAAGNLLLFAWLFRLNSRKSYHGQVVGSYLLVYSAFRFLVEFVRGDERGVVFDGLMSLPQFLALGMGAAGGLVLWARRPSGGTASELDTQPREVNHGR